MSLFLSRLTLKRSPDVSPLIAVLQPISDAQAIAVDHRLIWTVMPPDVRRAHDARRRDGVIESPFLWRRDDRPGRYYVLGPKPVDSSALFEIESKPFEAALAPGDKLQFLLRAHATVDRREGGRGTRRRSDIVMDLLHKVPSGERAATRLELAREAAHAWLSRRGDVDGFSLEPGAVWVDGYRVAPLARSAARADRGGEQSRTRRANGIGILDLRGILTVRDPDAFLARLRAGFGRAKAFGCGLMLIRRAA